ncbi:MAG TPA: DUF3313 domain-containing protein [Candidatus Hydrogenedentes bacterium]|nr:DUF3313 domain-containing protein [Candidatus Hydrogenedentota bacterium]
MNWGSIKFGLGSWRNCRGIGVVLAGVLLAYGIAGCASTSQARKVETSGFLGDYSALRMGTGEQAQLVYIDPSAKFKKYTKILMDPIVVYAADPDSGLHKIPAEELKSIIDYLDATVREQLMFDYAFVDKPEPDAMRLRIAITEAKGARVLLSAASTVTPAGLALNGIKKGVTGASTGVGEASCEMEILDSVTNRRLAAAVDSRVGGKANSFSKWEGVKDAYDFWAQRLRTRLAELRTQ